VSSTHLTSRWPEAKISVPARDRPLVSRPRVQVQLERVAGRGQILLIVALGGSGKTSAVAHWALHTQRAVAWYSCDPVDRDLRYFITGLCAAVDRVAPGCAREALNRLNDGATELAALSALLANQEQEHKPFALVIDDVHHLDEAPEAAALWDQLVRHRSRNCAIVLISRSIPVIRHLALVAAGQLEGVEDSALSFDVGEAAELLTAHGLDVAAAPIVRRMGGWAAGILLGARNSGNLQFLKPGLEAATQYLVDELLRSMPDAAQTFARESAAIGPASVAEVDAILGRSDSASRYAEVGLSGLMMEHDQASGVYRYHDLIAERLVADLVAVAPDRWRDIQQSAAAHWADHGDLPRALNVLSCARAWLELRNLLERTHRMLTREGYWSLALECIDSLPLEHQSAVLLTVGAYINIQKLEPEAGLHLAERALAVARDDVERVVSLRQQSSALLILERYDEALRVSDNALTLANGLADERQVNIVRQSRAIILYHIGDLRGARDEFSAATVALESADAPQCAWGYSNLMVLAGEAGDVGAAREYREAWMRAAKRHAVPLRSDACVMHSHLASEALLLGNPEEARRQAELSVSVISDLGQSIYLAYATAMLAEMCANAGDWTAAEDHGRAVLGMAASQSSRKAMRDALYARLWAALLRPTLDSAAAGALLEATADLSRTRREHAMLALFNGFLAYRQGQHVQAADLLRVADELEAMGYIPLAACALLLYAASLHDAADTHRRRVADQLNKLADLVLPLGCGGYLRPLARVVGDLLSARHELGRLRKDTAELLDNLAGMLPPLSVLRDSPPPLPEPDLILSPFGCGSIVIRGREIAAQSLPGAAATVLFVAGDLAHRGETISRDKIFTCVWDGMIDTTREDALWQANTSIRQLLGQTVWRADRRGSYKLDCTVRFEGTVFEDLCAVALGGASVPKRLSAAEQALALYGDGGYLEWCDSEWALNGREHAARLARLTTVALCHLYSEVARREDAIDLGWRALHRGEVDEGLMHILVRCLIDARRVSDAVAAYGEYARVLRDEYEAEPPPQLRRLVARLQADNR